MKRGLYITCGFILMISCSACYHHQPGTAASLDVVKWNVNTLTLTGKKLYLEKTEDTIRSKVTDRCCRFQTHSAYQMTEPATGAFIQSGQYTVMVQTDRKLVLRLKVQKGEWVGQVIDYQLTFLGHATGVYTRVIKQNTSQASQHLYQEQGVFEIKEATIDRHLKQIAAQAGNCYSNRSLAKKMKGKIL